VETAVVFAAIGLLVIVAYGDLRARRIPNVLSAAIAMLGLVRMFLSSDPTRTIHTAGASAAVFAAGFLLFWRGVLGGGDVKLLAAMVLLVGYRDLVGFLFLMSMCGGVLALAILARHKLRLLGRRPTRWTARQVSAPAQPTVPYGVAIAAAGVITLILNTSFAK
jgi:prepilin peptidase CpaA